MGPSSTSQDGHRATTLRVVTFDVHKRFDRPLHIRRRHRGLMANLSSMTAEQLFNTHRGIVIGAQECAKANDEANASIFTYHAQRVAAELARRQIEGEVTVVEDQALHNARSSSVPSETPSVMVHIDTP